MLNLTLTQLAILAAIIVVGVVLIAIVATIQARLTRRIPYIPFFYNSAVWYVPRSLRDTLLSYLSPRDRAFVARIGERLRRGRRVSKRDLARYNTLITSALDQLQFYEPALVVFFTPEGQAEVQRRIRQREELHHRRRR